jgi:hypothetical protein
MGHRLALRTSDSADDGPLRDGPLRMNHVVRTLPCRVWLPESPAHERTRRLDLNHGGVDGGLGRGVTLVLLAISPWSPGVTIATAMVLGSVGATLILAVRMRRLPPIPTSYRQPRWLIPAIVVVMLIGLAVVVVGGIAVEFWPIVVAGALGVLGNGLALWSVLLSRRRSGGRHN